MRLGRATFLFLIWLPCVCSLAPLYYSSTPHDYSGVYSVVLKRSAPPSSRESLIRSLTELSQDDEFKIIAKSHRTHLGFSARISPNILSIVRVTPCVLFTNNDCISLLYLGAEE